MKNNKLKLITAGLLAITITFTGTSALAANYADVPSSHKDYEEIHYLTDRGIISGYKDGTFKPNDSVTRAQASRIIWGGVENVDIQFPASQKRPMQAFRDVRKTDWHNPFVTNMFQYQIINGYPDNSFRPNETVTHAQLAKMVADAFQIPASNVNLPYTDVSSKNWYAPAVKNLYAAGIVTKSGTQFKPNQLMSRAEVSDYVANAMKSKTNKPTTVKPTPTPEPVVIQPVTWPTINTPYPQSVEMIRNDLSQGIGETAYNKKEITGKIDNALINEILTTDPNGFFVSQWTTYNTSGRLVFNFHQTSEQITQKTKENDDKANQIIRQIIKPGMTDYQKAKAVHDYIVLNTEYDYASWQAGTTPRLSYTSYGALNLGIAVCDGYARATRQLLAKVGIEAQYVTGNIKTGGYHAWNLVKLDGKYYHMDTTWDDPVPDRKGIVSHKYFLINDAEMANNRTWDNSKFPKAASNHPRN